MRLDASSRERRNNFDVLRLAAAAVVLVSHSFKAVGAGEPHIGHFPLGTLGVEVFFATSGFLVTKSWLSQPGLRPFAVKRGLRIMPALAVTVFMLAFVLGPAVSDQSLGSYFSAPATYAYPVDNVATVATGGTLRDVNHDLPGVFTANPDHSVDRSLWTLPIEVQAYIGVALFGALGLLAGGLPLLALGFFALSIAPAAVLNLPALGGALEFVRGADGEAAHLLAIFWVGALLYRYRDRIALRGDLAIVAALASAASLGTALERPVLVLCIPYLSLWFAYRSWGGLRRIAAHADVSYGLYLLAFPVQQTIVQVWGDSRPSPLTVALIAFPITYLLALCSWHVVEKHALRLKTTLATPRRARVARRRPASEPDPAPAPLPVRS